MRLLCLFVSLLVMGYLWAKEPKFVGVYYADDPPPEMFYMFDWLVLDPHASANVLKKKNLYIKHRRAKLFGYLSIFEISASNPHYKEVKPDWIIGENPYWKEKILDLTKEEVKDFLLKRAKEIVSMGFDGFFLDTLDSYKLALPKERWEEQRKALVEFIRELKRAFPKQKIILNWGFDVIEDVNDLIDGFMVEGLFSKIDFQKGGYRDTTEEERQWLIERLKPIAQKVPVIVVDYVDLPKEREKAKQIAKKIRSLGFIPYVSVKELNVIGIVDTDLVKRRALMFYEPSEPNYYPGFSDPSRLAQPYLEYWGYSVDLWDVTKGKPSFPLWDRYAVLVFWVNSQPTWMEDLILEAIQDGLKVVFIENLPTREQLLKKLDLEVYPSSKEGWKLLEKAPYVGYEVEPSPSFNPVVFPKTGSPLLIYAKGNLRYSPLAVTPWGGYALAGAYIRQLSQEVFVVNPYEFWREVLGEEDVAFEPVTTENGRRILTIHMDGDAFHSKTEVPGYTYSAEVLLKELLQRYPLPHTISLVEAELLLSKERPKLEEIARKIFSLPNVKPASHTFSHPFDWRKIEEKAEGYNLKIPGYKFDLKREILGSVDYVDSLAKPKKVHIFFWSGSANPPKDALELLYEAGLLNLNGGNTTISKKNPYLSSISPLGVDVDGYFQVYAPVMNENVYTNLWTGPFYGYLDVISTYELTDKPYRIKPVAIYYHTYSFSKVASFKALERVYQKVLTWKVIPMYVEDYAWKVLDFRSAVILKSDGHYIVRSGGLIRTLRLKKGLYPDLEKSVGVVGFTIVNGHTYVHLDPSGDYIIKLTDKPKERPYLIDSNGFVEYFEKHANGFRLKLKSYIEVDASVYLPKGCKMNMKRSPDNKEALIDVVCKEE
ncbi:endo alpha-1,4 polygalactosaminidase [Thermocrinis minervae]|uniref:Extracellular protein n=1 Tax=Thermocrinis minervae TaxID=381751 RepID=A0A1M6Q969_9AQUI|nr:endo alpha-1,4 polygalactosaminidase [Thermocrinis minervae]SHK16829.1 extracellular protein [Thermocrinis minervae]